MKKLTQTILAWSLGACLVLSGCAETKDNSENTNPDHTSKENTTNNQTEETKDQTSNSNGNESEQVTEITDLRTYELTAFELETFNILYSQNSTDLDYLTNCIDGLVSCDNEGKLVPAIASSWETNDGGLTWTFHLRDDVVWVDNQQNVKANCIAQDFITGLEWIMNFYKNDAINISMPIELIQGAEEYYEYTKGLSEEEALQLDTTKFEEMVGIAAPDDYTLVYTCTTQKPYFDTVATYNCLYPMSQAMVDELTVAGVKTLDNTTMWYNGAYTMTTFVHGNEKVLTKNEKYYDTTCKRFHTVTVKMVESNDVAYQMYQNGELDQVTLTESNLIAIYNSPSNQYYDNLVESRPKKYSYQFHFNYNKRLADGSEDVNWNTAIANKAFRLAWYYGLDLMPYYSRTDSINPYKCENNVYTMKGLIYFSDGTEYTAKVEELLGLTKTSDDTMMRLDASKFAEYKAQAIEELTAKGVTFPVEVDYYIAGSSQTALDTAVVLQQAFSDSFGDDFIVLNIKTYVSSLSTEVRDPRLQSFVINGWGADYGDPQNYLGQETYGEDSAYYSVAYSNINDATDPDLIACYEEYTRLVNEANQINDDLDARYLAYAQAESYMIENCLVIPCSYAIGWKLTHVNEYSKINAMFGIQNNKYVNWETSVEAYTTEQYEAFAAEALN